MVAMNRRIRTALATGFVGRAMLILAACPKNGAGPNAKDIVEAGTPVVQAVCQLVEGITRDGTVKSVCATLEEILEIASPFLMARREGGAPLAASGSCEPLPNTAYCATKEEKAEIVRLVGERRARTLQKGTVNP